MFEFLTIAAVALTTAVSTPEPVQWQADYGKALAATRSDDRPLLVVLDVPSDPKAALEGEQLKVTGDQANLLASYQLCHIDASTEYGQKVAQAFHADKFPFTAIIDKSGSVVLHKKHGQLTDIEWSETLAAYKSGERARPVSHTTAYRGEVVIEGSSYSSGNFTIPSSTPSIVSPSYCPSCQRAGQQNF